MAFNMTGADFDRTRLVINSDAQAIPAGSHPGRYNKPSGFKCTVSVTVTLKYKKYI